MCRAVSLGVCIGSIAAAADRINRPVAMRNLEIAFPQWNRQQRMAVLTAMYRNWGRMAAEWCHMGEITAQNISLFAHYEGVENWQRALESSNTGGGLLFSGHFGNFELLMAAHGLFGHPLSVVNRPLRNRMIDEAINRLRTSAGTRLTGRKGAAMEILSLISRGGVVGILIDLDVRRGVFVDFFSKKACTTPSLARFAIASGLPVVGAFMVRQDHSTHHRIVIAPPLNVVREGNREEAIRETTQRASRVLEDMIRQYPDHWNWIHRRWKTRPPGEQRFY